MFQLELIELLNQYKQNSNDNYSKQKIKNSISNLIKENKEKYENFLNTQGYNLDQTSKELLNKCENINTQQIQRKNVINNQQQEQKIENQNYPNNNNNNNQETNELSSSEYIKNTYYSWLEEFKKNNFKINENNEQIIDKIINRFALANFNLIKKILEIKDDNNYENFKKMLNNRLRIYFVKKIKEFRTSDKFNNLGFIKKIIIKREIFELYKQIGNYNFQIEKIKKIIYNIEK